MAAKPIPFLHVYEVGGDAESGVAPDSLLCFLDPMLAGARGIEPRSIVARLNPAIPGGIDPDSLVPNPAFVEAITGYMNSVAATSPRIVAQAATTVSDWLYVLDPLAVEETSEDSEPSTRELLGAFAVDDSGQVVPKSFQYNSRHALFDRDRGPSGLFIDRAFYNWLHGLGDATKN